MPLAPGTALQNGHYVIDALLEAAPNGDLYWGTHVVAGMPVFIQIFPVATTGDQPDLATLMARLEGVAFSPRSPLPQSFQLFRDNADTLCLVMGTTVGLPWSSARKHCSSMSPKQALKTIRQVASSVIWLKEQGLTGLDLAPNRVWLTPDHQQITLTGLPHAYLQNHDTAPATAPDTSAQALAKLLFSFLTGALLEPSPEPSSDTIRARLKQHRPQLSPVIVDAIARGVRSSAAIDQSLSLEQWLHLLPDAAAVHQVPLPSSAPPPVRSTPHPVSPASPIAPTPSRFRLAPALMGTALLAAIGGIALGTVWRLNAQSLPGAVQLDPQQSFPQQTGWSGDTPTADFDSPYVPARNVPVRREDWYETDTAEVWEAPPAPAQAAPVEPVEVVEPAPPMEPEPAPAISPEVDPVADPPSLPLEDIPEVAPTPAPAPAPVIPLEAPETPSSEGVSNANDAILMPSGEADPKALPLDSPSES